MTKPLDPRVVSQSSPTTADVFVDTRQRQAIDHGQNWWIENLKDRLATAELDTTALEGDVATLQTDVGTLQTDLAAAEADILTNASAISANAADIATNAADIATNAAAIASNDSDIAAIQAEQVTQNTFITSNVSSIATLNSTIAGIAALYTSDKTTYWTPAYNASVALQQYLTAKGGSASGVNSTTQVDITGWTVESATSGYTESSGEFTVPATGVYEIIAGYAVVLSSGTSSNFQVRMLENSSGSFVAFRIGYLPAATTTNTVSGQLSAIVPLNSGDKVKLTVLRQAGSGTGTVSGVGTSFLIRRIS